MTKSKKFSIASTLSALVLPLAFSVASADAPAASQDLVKLVSAPGKVLFLKDELVPATSLDDDLLGPSFMTMSEVLYQGSLRFVNHGDSSIDPGKVACDVTYRNSVEDTTFAKPLVGKQIRDGLLITGIDASMKAGQAVSWLNPDQLIDDPTSYSDTLENGSILRGIHLEFSDATPLMSIDCSQTVPANASTSPMTAQDVEQATGGLISIQAQ
jgi:hypothetical protein